MCTRAWDRGLGAVVRSVGSTPETIFADLISEAEYARQRCKSLRQIRRERAAGQGPKVIWLGRQPFYRIEAIREWVLAQEREPSSCPPSATVPAKRAVRTKGGAARRPAAGVCAIDWCTAPVEPKEGPGPKNRYCREHLPLPARRAARRARL